MLAANSVQEISLKVNPLLTGRRMMFLKVVGKIFFIAILYSRETFARDFRKF